MCNRSQFYTYRDVLKRLAVFWRKVIGNSELKRGCGGEILIDLRDGWTPPKNHILLVPAGSGLSSLAFCATGNGASLKPVNSMKCEINNFALGIAACPV